MNIHAPMPASEVADYGSICGDPVPARRSGWLIDSFPVTSLPLFGLHRL
jgi:hypothetical protein